MVFLIATLVAHVSVVDGRAAIVRAGGGAVAALRNAPLLVGDTLLTHRGSRAEIQFDPNVAVRLDQSTRVQIIGLAYGRREVRVIAGSVAASMLREDDAPKIDTPPVGLQPVKPGLYRVTVTAGQADIDVRRGTMMIRTPNGSQVLTPGETVSVTGPSAQPDLHYGSPQPSDAFDAYNASRDAAILAAQREWRLPSSLAGYVNLREYGSWITLKSYGIAWRPREYPGWAPYRLGRWFWRSGTGWVWIPRESWGWLPYHYGAWKYDVRQGWCWIPPRSRFPAWSASTAIFFALIRHGRTQSIGWLPLAPGEPFRSTLGSYRNARSPGAITLLAVGDFYAGLFSKLSAPPPNRIPAGARLEEPPSPRRYHSVPSPSRM